MARTLAEVLHRFEMDLAAHSPPFSRRSRELHVLAGLDALDVAVTQRIVEVVQACREQGASWSEIAATLHVSKQAAHERFGQHKETTPRARTAPPAATGDQVDPSRSDPGGKDQGSASSVAPVSDCRPS